MTISVVLNGDALATWQNHEGEDDGDAITIEENAMKVNSGRTPYGVRLDADRVVVAYEDGSGNGTLAAVNLTTGTVGTLVDLGASFIPIKIDYVSTNKFAVLWLNASSETVLRTYTVSTLTITQDATETITTDATATYAHSFTVLTSTLAFSQFYNGTNVVVDQVTIGSGSLSAAGSAVTLLAGASLDNGTKFDIQRLSDTEAISKYCTSNTTTAVQVTSGSPPTLGTPTGFSGANSTQSSKGGLAINGDGSIIFECGTSGGIGLAAAADLSSGSITKDDTNASTDRVNTGPIGHPIYIENDGTYDVFAAAMSAMGGGNKSQIAFFSVEDKNTISFSTSKAYGAAGNTRANMAATVVRMSDDAIAFMFPAASTNYPTIVKVVK